MDTGTIGGELRNLRGIPSGISEEKWRMIKMICVSTFWILCYWKNCQVFEGVESPESLFVDKWLKGAQFWYRQEFGWNIHELLEFTSSFFSLLGVGFPLGIFLLAIQKVKGFGVTLEFICAGKDHESTIWSKQGALPVFTISCFVQPPHDICSFCSCSTGKLPTDILFVCFHGRVEVPV